MSCSIQKKLHNFSIVLLKIFLQIVILLFAICVVPPILVVSYFVGKFSKKNQIKIASAVSFITWQIFNLIFCLTCTIETKNIPKDNYLVVSNHITAIDFVLVNNINKHMFSSAKYAFKDSLRVIPVFYQAVLLLKFLVLSRSFEHDRLLIEKYISDLRKEKLPLWFVLFCEGTRFDEKKKKEADEFCKANGMKPFNNVLCPRYKGFSIFQQNLKNSYIKKVLDLTFYCKEGSFSAFDMLLTAKRFNFKLDFRIVDLNSIEDPKQFVEDSFRRKDMIIGRWKEKQN